MEGVAAVPCSNDRVVHVFAVMGRCDCQIKLMASSDTPTITPLPNKKFPSKFISAISNCIVILVRGTRLPPNPSPRPPHTHPHTHVRPQSCCLATSAHTDFAWACLLPIVTRPPSPTPSPSTLVPPCPPLPWYPPVPLPVNPALGGLNPHRH